MISFTRGNLLDADTEAIVNAVNTAGVMGKGIALTFKKRFPDNFTAYSDACKLDGVRLGEMFVFEREEPSNPKYIINFPTKSHWRVKTKLEWIRTGLTDLGRVIDEKRIRSIATPALGCGHGGLHWDEVRPLIVAVLEGAESTDVVIYEPTVE